MNTKKYDNKPFDVDTKKCREKCDMNEDKLCKKQDFLLHNFCNDIRDDECKRERDYCSCWRLVRMSFRVAMIVWLDLGEDKGYGKIHCLIGS